MESLEKSTLDTDSDPESLWRAPVTPLVPTTKGTFEKFKYDTSPRADRLVHTVPCSALNRQQDSPRIQGKRKFTSAAEASPAKKQQRLTSVDAGRTVTSHRHQKLPQSASERKQANLAAGTPLAKKPSRTSAGYAPPSKYSHVVNKLTDSLAPNLICLFIGLNPGIRTAITGHAYNHPSNLFWKLLYKSGCTPRLCRAEEDGDLPRLYELGLTNIVSRPTKDGGELSKIEMDAGVAELEAKIALQKPEAVAIVGKSIWESIWRVRHGSNIKKDQFRYGWQKDIERMGVMTGPGDQWSGARIFVATTTSGLAAGMRPQEKEDIWKNLGEWVEKRRHERTDEQEKPNG
ncbi:MAG: hypothetical protein L6R41_001697 [Letrouitia leprolyta]|nr:MAG: hypothetical protein L6R41_001697 [Letrouitia leprolyta]